MELSAIPVPGRDRAHRPAAPGWVLIGGLIAFVLPTMIDVARTSWSTEQGAQGPIVLATGLWLISLRLAEARAVARPGSAALTLLLLAPLLAVFTIARITGIIEVESISMYAVVLTVAYAVWGGAALRRVWFALLYLLFVFPPPDTLFAMATQPLKIAVSEWAVAILHAFGLPIAGSGVTIQIGQYQMLVAAACAGLNSLISLISLGLFYSYVRHNSNWRYMLLLVLCIVPIAVLANLIRVLLLLLVTYFLGESAGQGFFHDLAGMTMFVSALLGIFALDWLAAPLRRRLARNGEAA